MKTQESLHIIIIKGIIFDAVKLWIVVVYIVKNHIAKKYGTDKTDKLISIVLIFHIPLLAMLAVTPFAGVLYTINDNNVYSRSWGYWIWQIVSIITFMIVLFVIIKYWKKTNKYLRRLMLTAIVIPLIALVMSIVFPGISFVNIVMAVTSLIVFLFYEKNKTDVMVQFVYELERSRLDLENSRLELEESKMKILNAQIQPHFIYNSLMAIQARTVDNPELYNIITFFGKYLRTHFEAISDDTLITFSDELKNIRAYLQLERLNYGDRLQVEYDIEIDQFMVPALSVEPLVENAVRYGIGTYEQGGVVRIIVRDEKEFIEVEVHDDGSGGNILTDAQKSRKSIGIENVRLRLKTMEMGELILKQDDHGTSAIIRLKCEDD